MDRLVQEELALQKKDEENRAHRAKMDAIDKRLKEKQEALRRLEAETAEKKRQQEELKKRGEAEQQRKNADVQKELELMKARREAYEERLALKQKVEERKRAEEKAL